MKKGVVFLFMLALSCGQGIMETLHRREIRKRIRGR